VLYETYVPSFGVICSADFHLAELKAVPNENIKTLILSINFSASVVCFEARKVLLKSEV
jgi:hypothetical protein